MTGKTFGGRLAIATLLMISVVGIGTVGYHTLGEGRWSWFDCSYFTIITLASVGYGELLPGLDLVPYARLFTIGLICLGSGALVYFVSNVTALVVEGDLQGALRRNRMIGRIARMRGHVIVCGVGSTGIHIVDGLFESDRPFVAIDRDEDRLLELAERYRKRRFLFVVGDATTDETLERAGIAHASGLVSALHDDKENLFVTMSAHQLTRSRPAGSELRIVSKAVEPTAIPKLIRAGAHRVVSPSHIGGIHIANEMVRPSVVEFMDKILHDPAMHLGIEEVLVPTDSPVLGQTLRDSPIRRAARVLVLAVKWPGDTPQYEYNPAAETRIESGMTLFVLGQTSELARLREAFARGFTDD